MKTSLVLMLSLVAFGPQSLWDNLSANPAVAVSAIGALVAALITLVSQLLRSFTARRIPDGLEKFW